MCFYFYFVTSKPMSFSVSVLILCFKCQFRYKVKTLGSWGEQRKDKHRNMVAVSKISWKAMYLEQSHSVSIHTHTHSGAHRHDRWWQLQVVGGMRCVPAREFISVSRGLFSLTWGAGRGGLWKWNLRDEITAAEWALRWQIDLFLKPFF